MPLTAFVAHIDEMVIGRPAGTAVWLTKVEHGISPMLLHHVKHNAVLHQTVVLLTVTPDRRPRVPFAERHSWSGSATASTTSPCGSASCSGRTSR